MSRNELPVAMGFVATAFEELLKKTEPLIYDATRAATEATLPPEHFEAYVAHGGWKSFIAASGSAVLVQQMKNSAFDAAVILYLEEEHTRRQAWEQSVEERLSGALAPPLGK